MAVGAVIGAAAIGAATTVYTTRQAEIQANRKPVIPQMPEAPKLPNTQGLGASLQQGDLAAKTAGGTILSDKGSGVSDGANGQRKALLGN